MLESFLSLIATTTLLLGSPGPAPIALAATGAAFGIKKTIPFLLGILVGLLCAIIATIAGLSVLFASFPNLRLICQLIGAVYIAYIAYKIATSPILSDSASQIAPSFRDGFILNLLNPKAYAAFAAIFSQFLLPFSNFVIAYISTGLVCFLIATIVDVIWLCFGGVLKPIFSHPMQARGIRIVFAVLMLAAVVYALM